MNIVIAILTLIIVVQFCIIELKVNSYDKQPKI
ncbi:hypothetical protein QE417_003028 [Mucilaginibacter terrae]|uniref:Uncharacterized protein n=1 Tax=Mucilaginibacter terrae TaxID=1955052 RepID=A0ABU3GWV5_9SPHI|nr:hypothetical protein [Mucilaginibacter terrae]